MRMAMLVMGAVLAAAPATAAPPRDAYGRLPALEQVEISPAGERLAFITVAGEARTLFAATRDGKPLAKALVGKAKVRSLDWAGEDLLLVTYSETAKLPPEFVQRQVELASIATMDLKSKSLRPLFSGARSMANFIVGHYGARKVDGRWFLFVRAYRTHDVGVDHPDLYRVDIERGTADRIAESDERTEGWVIDDRGEVAA
jgi:hypothetical protein